MDKPRRLDYIFYIAIGILAPPQCIRRGIPLYIKGTKSAASSQLPKYTYSTCVAVIKILFLFLLNPYMTLICLVLDISLLLFFLNFYCVQFGKTCKMITWSLWILFSTSIFSAFIYFGFFWKINWIQNLDGNNKKGAYCGRVKKSRQIGNINPIYPNGWFALLQSWELAKEQVKYVSALGEHFAVFRTKEGIVNIIDAYCPHLGANMAQGGRVIGNCLECPFHQWTFRGDGHCNSIPYSKKIPSSAKTRAWRCLEVNKTIFVWYHAELEDPDWHPLPVNKIDDNSWWYHGRNEFFINCHIQEIPENGADWAHLTAVHGAGILDSILPGLSRHSWTDAFWSTKKYSNADHESDDSSSDRSNHHNIKTEKHRAIMSLIHNVILFEKISIMKLNIIAEQIGPGYVELNIQTSLGPMCILQTVTPIEPLVQRVTHSIFSPPLTGPYARIILLGECLMFERDVAIWNHKKFLRNPVLVAEEKNIKLYRRWYGQFYSPNSPTYQSMTALEW